MPAIFAVRSAVAWNGSVTTTHVGRDRRSNSMLSYRLHEVHPPQSPTPVMMAWLFAESESSRARGAIREGSGLISSSHSMP